MELPNADNSNIDLLETASMLMKLLDLSQVEVEALLKGEVKPVIKQPTRREVCLKEQEYILIKRHTCLTCCTTSEYIFHMRQVGKTNCLSAIQLEADPGTMSVTKEISNVITCQYCKENLMLLEKEDIIALYLEHRSRDTYIPTLETSCEYEEKFQSLVPKVKSRIQKEDNNETI